MACFTFATLLPGRVDVVHLSDLLIGVFIRSVAKVNIDVDTISVINALGALRRTGIFQEKLKDISNPRHRSTVVWGGESYDMQNYATTCLPLGLRLQTS